MTIGVGNLILASDYTTIKASVDAIFGTGAGQSGYGQTITSPAVLTGASISHIEWDALRNDMIKCRQHQNGTTVGSLSPTDAGYVGGENLIIPTTGLSITQVLAQQYSDFASLITTEKHLVDSAQQTSYSLNSQTRVTEWNGIVTHTVTITDTNNNLRYFFNSGSYINFTASRTGGTGTIKDTDWTNMLSAMGSIKMNYNSTTSSSGTGTGTSIGFNNLTTTDQLIYTQSGGATFTANKYYIYAKVDNATTPTVITLTIDFEDLDTSGTDINVTGTLSSTVKQVIATGSNVAVAQLTASASSFTGGVPVPTYLITPNTTVATQGTVVTFNISTTQLPASSVLTMSITGGVVAADFVQNTLSGGPYPNGNSSFTLTMATFLTNQDLKTFTVNLLDNGVIVASTAMISIPPKGISYYAAAVVKTVGTFIVGKTYRVVNAAGTTNTNWNIIGGTSGSPIVYATGTDFVAANTGSGFGTGTANEAQTFTIPTLVTSIVVSGLGGGGGSGAYHDGGYGEHANGGGPGGGVSGVIATVASGNVCSFFVGAGGGPGYYAGTDVIGYGHDGTATEFLYNGTSLFTCNEGTTGYGGAAGTSTITVGYSGSTSIGGTCSAMSTVDSSGIANKYDPWSYVDTGGFSIANMGSQAVSFPTFPRNGLAQYPGIIEIAYQ